MATPRLDLSKMIRLDEVGELLGSMMERLDAQEATIGSLQRLCASLLSKNTANEVFDDIQRSLEGLTRRLDQVQQAATSDLGNAQVIPAGELAFLNSVHIQRIQAGLHELARRSDVDTQLQGLEEQLNRSLVRVQSESTPADVGVRLQEQQASAAARVTGMEGLLACKVDRSEVNTLHTLASRLETFAAFRDATTASFIEHAERASGIEKRVDSHDAHLSSLDHSLADATAVMSTFAPRSQTAELQKELDALAASLRLAATKASLQKSDDNIAAILSRLGRKDAHDEALSHRVDAAHADLATKAPLTDVRACVLRAHYDAAITALGSDLDTKASIAECDAVRGRLSSLEECQESESARLKVAMRFVDWFTSRGENYEHNLKLVDKHLRNLATAANPADRAPFAGQVRFTPFMESGPEI